MMYKNEPSLPELQGISYCEIPNYDHYMSQSNLILTLFDL